MNEFKVLVLIAISFMLTGIVSAQSDTAVIKFSERKPVELKFDVTLKETVAIGYAYCFDGTVVKVHHGPLKDQTVLFTVLPGDTAKYNVMKAGNDNTVYTVYCMHRKNDEEYSTAYITGFVDSKKSSWMIVDIVDKSKENNLLED
jgi:hypothetical protein